MTGTCLRRPRRDPRRFALIRVLSFDSRESVTRDDFAFGEGGDFARFHPRIRVSNDKRSASVAVRSRTKPSSAFQPRRALSARRRPSGGGGLRSRSRGWIIATEVLARARIDMPTSESERRVTGRGAARMRRCRDTLARLARAAKFI